MRRCPNSRVDVCIYTHTHKYQWKVMSYTICKRSRRCTRHAFVETDALYEWQKSSDLFCPLRTGGTKKVPRPLTWLQQMLHGIHSPETCSLLLIVWRSGKKLNVSSKQLTSHFQTEWLQIKCGGKLLPLALKMSNCMTAEK